MDECDFEAVSAMLEDDSDDDDIGDDELDRLASLVEHSETGNEGTHSTAEAKQAEKQNSKASPTAVSQDQEPQNHNVQVTKSEMKEEKQEIDDSKASKGAPVQDGGESSDSDYDELHEQMRRMQEQMALLANKIQTKKKKKSSPRSAESTEDSEGNKSAEDPSSEKKSDKRPALRECNLFDIIDQEKETGKGDAASCIEAACKAESAPWERKRSTPSSGYKLSSSSAPATNTKISKELEAKLSTTVDKIAKKTREAPAVPSAKLTSAEHHVGQVDEKGLELELFGNDSDSDWADLDGEKTDNLSKDGREIKQLLKKRVAHNPNYDASDLEKFREKKPSANWNSPTLGQASRNGLAQVANSPGVPSAVPKSNLPTTPFADESNVMIDPFSSIRIVNPQLSEAELRSRMRGRRHMKLSHLAVKRNTSALEGDWVTIGVIAHKVEPRMSQNNKQFSVWKLTDLDNCDQIVHLYLFGEVHKTHWKTIQGSVVGLLNPSIMKSAEKYAARDAVGVSLTLDDKMKLMLMGTSKDLGVCKARSKVGKPCTNYINKNRHEFCAYHVQQQYKRMSSKRGELSGSFNGVTPKNHQQQLFKNKNSTVIYGGKTYTSESMAVSGARRKKDNITLAQLQTHVASNIGSNKVSTLSLHNLVPEDRAKLQQYEKQLKDRERRKLEKDKPFHDLLTVPTMGAMNFVKHLATKDNVSVGKTDKAKKVVLLTAKELLKMSQDEFKRLSANRKAVSLDAPPPPTNERGAGEGGAAVAPTLGCGLAPDVEIQFDFDAPPQPMMPPLVKSRENRLKNLDKKMAIANVLAKGGIKKTDPNAVKTDKTEVKKKVKKRLAEDALADESSEPDNKRSRLLGNIDLNDPEVQRLLKKKSAHAASLTEEEQEKQEAYFEVLEKKEAMEDQMDKVTKQKVKAVVCKQCKYRALKPTDRCREERHTLVYEDAYRRWFKCSQCGQKCTSLDRLPTEPCKNCGSSSFAKSSMLYEKKGPKLPSEELLLRGEERKFVNS